MTKVKINSVILDALIDSGSTGSFINPRVIKQLSLSTLPSTFAVSMASNSYSSKTEGICVLDLELGDRSYTSVELAVLPNLCVDIILGQDFQRLHSNVTVQYDGDLPPLVICGLSTLRVEAPELFSNLSADWKPIAARTKCVK